MWGLYQIGFGVNRWWPAMSHSFHSTTLAFVRLRPQGIVVWYTHEFRKCCTTSWCCVCCWESRRIRKTKRIGVKAGGNGQFMVCRGSLNKTFMLSLSFEFKMFFKVEAWMIRAIDIASSKKVRTPKSRTEPKGYCFWNRSQPFFDFCPRVSVFCPV